jgi:hypothetical protein
VLGQLQDVGVGEDPGYDGVHVAGEHPADVGDGFPLAEADFLGGRGRVASPPRWRMAMSKETRVRRLGFWKSMPSTLPGRTGRLPPPAAIRP